MKNYTIKQYELQDYENWNTFISKAKNATFLFHRDFMEYHSDRFLDASLIVLVDKKELRFGQGIGLKILCIRTKD